jgi:hypothetical protein
MPHPIIEISELTQVILDHCLLGNEWSLVSLACTCRALEEQALSTLWSEQSSFVTLIESALPPGILTPSKPLPQVRWVQRLLRGSFLIGVSSLQTRIGTSFDDMRPGCAGSSWIGSWGSQERSSI